MREILFKAQRADGKGWVEGYPFEEIKPKYRFSYIITASFVHALSMPSDNFIEVESNSVCQYTGLKDKNGAKAWGNDKCNYEYWIQTSQDPDSGVSYSGEGIIEFIEGCFMINPLSKQNPIPLHYPDLTFTITSNIHDYE